MTTLRIGVIGVGHLGKEHARIASSLPGVQLAGVADLNVAQAEAVAERCGTKAYADYRQLFEHIDAAVIAVPTCHHYTVAAEVLSHGIPALVEKPLAATLPEAENLLALGKKHGVLLQVGHIERFNPAFEALQGRPLTPKYVYCERIGGHTGRSSDVGVVLDLMIHDIDLLLALVSSPVTRVEALGVSVLGAPEDMATARVTFADGCIADLRASRLAASPLRRMQAWGPEGFASIDFARKHLTLMQPSPALCRHRSGEQPFDAASMATMQGDLFGRHLQTMDFPGDGCDQLTAELKDFVRCVRADCKPRVGGEEGCAALQLATRILEAIAQHAWDSTGAHVGPNAFTFPGASLFQLPGQVIAA